MFLLVALAAVFVLLGHDALMAAAPPVHGIQPSAALVVVGDHQRPEAPPHPPECGTVQVVAAPRAGDDFALSSGQQRPTAVMCAAVRLAVDWALDSPDRAVPRSLLQVWRI